MAQLRSPLSGLLVVSLEHAIAAPLCTRHLADMGARVIKIERPGVGDFARHYDKRVRGLASHFVWANRSKESLSLDLKHERASDIMARLLGRCDVLVQNLAPGASAKLGFDVKTLNKSYPRLIVCNISGFGSSGPYRDKKAYDLLIQAEAGFLSVTGSEQEPAKSGCSIADIAAAMYAQSAILAALLQRHDTNKGESIEISMFDVMVEWMGYPMYYAFDGAAPPARTGAAHATIYPYGPFTTADGVVLLGIQNEREWGVFCAKILQAPSLQCDARFETNSARTQHRTELKHIIEAKFANINTEALIRRLDEAAIANGKMNNMASVWQHPQLLARDAFTTVHSEMGPVPVLRPTWLPQGTSSIMGSVPALGEHTEQILTELGYTPDQIGKLRATNAI